MKSICVGTRSHRFVPGLPRRVTPARAAWMLVGHGHEESVQRIGGGPAELGKEQSDGFRDFTGAGEINHRARPWNRRWYRADEIFPHEYEIGNARLNS